MANLNTKFKKILENLETNIKDEESLEFVKIQLFDLYNMFFEEFNKLEEVANSRLAEIMRSQVEIENKMQNMELRLKSIQKDIYLEDDDEDSDEDYDFSIICPYCNKEFKVESDKLSDEITCPECKNVIELDWGDECDCDECSHDCHKDDESDEDM